MAGKVGTLIDRLYLQDQAIDKLELSLREAKHKRQAIENRLFNGFKSQELSGARGKLALASIRETRHPTIRDRSKFMKYVLGNKAFDLFQNRISSKAYFDRIEDGEKIGGVEIFVSKRISVTRQKRG